MPASIAKGRIATLDTAAAEAMPGVVAVLTYRNAPKQGKESQQVSPELVDDRIRYYGQAVACVVAETFEQARAAAYAVEVGYAPDPVNAVLGGQRGQGGQAEGPRHHSARHVLGRRRRGLSRRRRSRSRCSTRRRCRPTP